VGIRFPNAAALFLPNIDLPLRAAQRRAPCSSKRQVTLSTTPEPRAASMGTKCCISTLLHPPSNSCCPGRGAVNVFRNLFSSPSSCIARRLWTSRRLSDCLTNTIYSEILTVNIGRFHPFISHEGP